MFFLGPRQMLVTTPQDLSPMTKVNSKTMLKLVYMMSKCSQARHPHATPPHAPSYYSSTPLHDRTRMLPAPCHVYQFTLLLWDNFANSLIPNSWVAKHCDSFHLEIHMISPCTQTLIHFSFPGTFYEVPALSTGYSAKPYSLLVWNLVLFQASMTREARLLGRRENLPPRKNAEWWYQGRNSSSYSRIETVS